MEGVGWLMAVGFLGKEESTGCGVMVAQGQGVRGVLKYSVQRYF
jgi:hypothetical protein